MEHPFQHSDRSIELGSVHIRYSANPLIHSPTVHENLAMLYLRGRVKRYDWSKLSAIFTDISQYSKQLVLNKHPERRYNLKN